MDGPENVEPPEGPPSVRHELTDAVREVGRVRVENPRPHVADDLLMLFGRIAGLILVAAVALTAVLAVFRPAVDISGLTNLLNTQLSLIIGAVLGYAAHPSEKDS